MLQNITLRLSKRQKNTRNHMFFCLILPAGITTDADIKI